MSGAAPQIIPASVLVAGNGRGDVFALQEPLSFWGGLDVASGRIIDRRHPQAGESVQGRILVMSAGRGSSSGSSVLAEAIRLGTGPAGLVLLTRDAIVTVGAMVAFELYGKHCPVVVVEQRFWSRIETARHLSISAGGEHCEIAVDQNPVTSPPASA